MADNDRKIDEATQDTEITGVEKFPVSDNSSPKFATIADLKDFVLKCLREKAAVEDVAMDTSYVYVTYGNETYRIKCDEFADKVIYRLFGKEAIGSSSDISGDDIIPIETIDSESSNARTVSIDNFVAYIRTQISDMKVDISGLSSRADAVADDDDLAVAKQDGQTSIWSTFKSKASVIASYVIGKIRGAAVESSAAIGANDEILTYVGTDHVLKRTKFSDLGIGGGNVNGPSANTGDNIPQWDGGNSKLLKDGLELVKSVQSGDPISSESTNSQVPSAAAVYQHVSNAVGTNGVYGPVSTTESKIPQWDDTTRTLKNGLTLTTDMATSTASASDEKVPSEKAVNKLIGDRKVVESSALSPTSGNIVQWDTGYKVKNGYPVDSSVASGTGIPTSAAVRTAIAACGDVKAPQLTTSGKIPTWNGSNTKQLNDGLSLSTAISASSSDSEVPSALAVKTYVTSTTSSMGDVTAPQNITQGKIPKWHGNSTKQLDDGYAVSTAMLPTPAGMDSTILTAGAIYYGKYIRNVHNSWFINRLLMSSIIDNTCTAGPGVQSSKVAYTSQDTDIPDIQCMIKSCMLLNSFSNESDLLGERNLPVGSVAIVRDHPSRIYYFGESDGTSEKWYYIAATEVPTPAST